MSSSLQRIALLIVLAAPGLCASCSQAAPERVESAGVAPVLTVRAVEGTIRDQVHATGLVQPAPGADLTIVAPEAARVVEIPKAEGERVRRGDLLVRFEIPSLTSDLERQEAEVRRAEAAVTTAEAARTRAHELYDRGVAARRDVEEADRALADAQAALAQAGSSRSAAAAVASRAIVRSAFDGIVARRWHNPGDLVEPSASDPVLRVVDLDRLEVVALVPLHDAGRVESGATARLTAGPPDAVGARLTVVSQPASVQQGTASVPVRLVFDSRQPMPVNTPVEVAIDGKAHQGLTVPTRAIVREGDQTSVFVVTNETARRTPVTLGTTDDDRIEVTSGLEAGAEVVVEGQAGLPDGAPVASSPAEPPQVEPPRASAGQGALR